MDTYEIIGITGAGLILFGFYRTSIGRWTNKSFWYELDNLVGSMLLIVYALGRKAPVSIVMHTVWAIVAFQGLTSFAERRNKIARRRKRNRAKR